MGFTLTLNVEGVITTSISEMIVDACKLANTLELCNVNFKANGCTYFCYFDNTTVRFDDAHPIRTAKGVVQHNKVFWGK